MSSVERSEVTEILIGQEKPKETHSCWLIFAKYFLKYQQ